MAVSPARAVAFDVLLRVERDRAFAPDAMHAARSGFAGLSLEDRHLCQQLVMGLCAGNRRSMRRSSRRWGPVERLPDWIQRYCSRFAWVVISFFIWTGCRRMPRSAKAWS